MPEPIDPNAPAPEQLPPAELLKPGAGGWTPKQVQTFVAACVIGGAVAMLDIADAPDITPKRLAITFAKGFVGFAATYLGMKSAGIRKGVGQ